MSIEQLAVDTIKALSMDGVQRANSGHPGMPMGMADLAVVLWTKHLLVDPTDPEWPDRDRFVLSNGHGSMLLYSLLHLAGFGLTMDDLRSFRQFGSHTAGHPERDHHLGIEMTTGPLGQGFGTGVGLALLMSFSTNLLLGLAGYLVLVAIGTSVLRRRALKRAEDSPLELFHRLTAGLLRNPDTAYESSYE